MKVKIKKLNEKAVIPKYAKAGDAGLDLTAVTKEFDGHGNISYGIGLAIEIPKGYVGLLFPRSSNSKKDLLLTNSVGVIDSGYRGEIIVKFKPSNKILPSNTSNHGLLQLSFGGISNNYEIGERVAQLIIIPYPDIELVESNELSETERGEGGFGSTNEIVKKDNLYYYFFTKEDEEAYNELLTKGTLTIHYPTAVSDINEDYLLIVVENKLLFRDALKLYREKWSDFQVQYSDKLIFYNYNRRKILLKYFKDIAKNGEKWAVKILLGEDKNPNDEKEQCL